LEAGVGFSTSYPGTPASEIGDTFAKTAKENGIYFEWSTNEKTALEAAAGAAFSGIKSMVSFKHYGLNVALDSLLPLTYLECPLVVVFADDPGSWSSIQTEQDSRWFALMGKIPMFEPADASEAKAMTVKAFEIAWKFKLPVFIRMTTRVSYSKSAVILGTIPKTRATQAEQSSAGEKSWIFQLQNSQRILDVPSRNKISAWEANFKRGFETGSAVTVARHRKLLDKIEKIKLLAEKSEFNFADSGKSDIGIVTSGVSYLYAKEALNELGTNLPILKLGFTWPFPCKILKSFVRNLKQVIVIEELEPFLEDEVRENTHLKVYGKDIFPEYGEIKPEEAIIGIAKVLNKQIPKNLQDGMKSFNAGKVPERTPLWCAGCPHRATFYAIKTNIGTDKIFGGDIGCYLLGAYKPYAMYDFILSMGASVGVSHGIAKATGKKPVVFIGDSTFFHAGIPALINMVYNKADALVVVLDNRITAMTGQQPNPGMGLTGMGEATKAIAIEDIARACKSDFVKVTNVWNYKQLCKDVRESYEKKGVSVLVAKGECRLLTVRKMAREGKQLMKFEIDAQSPKLDELKEFSCPAISKSNGKWTIDKRLCWGCSVCMQLFPDCIRVRHDE
ncbi:MAG: thiamine pyrophosphate-dependent enzyme, partial [archaeon]